MRVFVAVHHGTLVDIAHVDDGLGGEEHEVARHFGLVLVELYGAGALAGEECVAVEIHDLDELLGAGVAAGFAFFDLFVVAVLYGLEVLELQLGVYG